MTYRLHKNYNCKVTTENLEEFLVDAKWLDNNNLDNWKDWECYAGVNRIWIEHDGSVFGGECKNDYLGQATSNWDLLKRPTTCKYSRCSGCMDDLIVEKHRTKK